MPTEDSRPASLPTDDSFFEGAEKKMELVVDPSLPSFRERGRAVWDRVCERAGAKILSTLENERCAAYLLSESSLFVFDHKLVMITCGRTRLTDAVVELLREIPEEAVRFFVYERKNEVYPHEQPSSFRDDARLLHARLPGRAYLFGQQHAQHVMLYHLDRPYRSETPDLTVELLMYDLDAAARPLFVAEAAGDPARIAARSAIDRILPGFEVDKHQFAPSGYSVNAIRAEEYWTVHVTPERTSSYASFETNHRFEGNLEWVVSELLDLFRPGSFDLVLFEQGSDRPFAAEGYRLRSDVAESLSCGYDVRFRSYFRPPDGVGRPQELAVD